MHRALAALGVLVLACVVGVAAPAGSGASATATATAKSKCKHRHPHNRKHCRKKVASESPSGAGGGGGGAGGSTNPASPPGRLLATEREISPTELQLQLSRPSLSAGPAIVEQHNAGEDPHNLILEQAGFVAFSFDTLDPGGNARQTVTLKRGTYTLYCSLLDHRSLGMQATLTVN